MVVTIILITLNVVAIVVGMMFAIASMDSADKFCIPTCDNPPKFLSLSENKAKDNPIQ